MVRIKFSEFVKIDNRIFYFYNIKLKSEFFKVNLVRIYLKKLFFFQVVLNVFNHSRMGYILNLKDVNIVNMIFMFYILLAVVNVVSFLLILGGIGCFLTRKFIFDFCGQNLRIFENIRIFLKIFSDSLDPRNSINNSF